MFQPSSHAGYFDFQIYKSVLSTANTCHTNSCHLNIHINGLCIILSFARGKCRTREAWEYVTLCIWLLSLTFVICVVLPGWCLGSFCCLVTTNKTDLKPLYKAVDGLFYCAWCAYVIKISGPFQMHLINFFCFLSFYLSFENFIQYSLVISHLLFLGPPYFPIHLTSCSLLFLKKKKETKAQSNT